MSLVGDSEGNAVRRLISSKLVGTDVGGLESDGAIDGLKLGAALSHSGGTKDSVDLTSTFAIKTLDAQHSATIIPNKIALIVKALRALPATIPDPIPCPTLAIAARLPPTAMDCKVARSLKKKKKK